MGFPDFKHIGTGQVTGIYALTPNPYLNSSQMYKINFLYPFYIDRNSNPKSFQSHSQSLSLLDDIHLSYIHLS